MRNISRNEFIQQFQLNLPAAYHQESLLRVAHLTPDSLRKASVLIGVVERQQGLQVILTKRAAHLRHHPGQISFPGGKYEESDHSLQQTAKREAREEIGISEEKIHIVGQLPELVTVSQFAVTPILAFVESDYQIQLDHNEVDEVFEVPISFLLDRKKLYTGTFQLKNHRHRVFAIPYKQHFIWGMTAQIIQSLQKQFINYNELV
ncbi:CoA pyrophosphatase [Vibrio mimicus]|uniref:MutT/NUDIX family protein n=1 Tax=Vibrio mimicus VM603 TaxID=671074 RepID=D2YJJ1_VIBMI|nr:CoA pyrophosphatase [Vibrio mimicus]EEW05164.1 MutT/NUDIX family protein [Vibrio mimicus VM603]TXY07408.1 CoA pyrophosphatase [Vibrio mimicus]TXY23708.1 CoA pyrophosphatase [Vibrio mimicus]TXY44880.1 CoA pyrophosphatase [Vibrio mimicus]TXZ74912.1 CoA pyrophosphatase [Vibrio mimicus]